MANKVVALNQEDVSVHIRVLDDSDGTPYTAMTAATTGHEIWYQRGYDNAVVTDGGSAADLTLITDGHTDWNFLHVREGWYRVDMPNACFAEDASSVIIGMNATGYTGISVTVEISPILKFQGTPSAVTATTTTIPAGQAAPLKGDIIMVTQGTGDPGNQVLVSSAAGQVATHAAFETAITNSATTVAVIAGDAVTADGGLNLGATTASQASVDQLLEGIIFGSAQTGTLTTLAMTTDLTGYADDELIGATVVWSGGTADGQRAEITDYASASGLVSFSAGITTAPSDGDTFKIV